MRARMWKVYGPAIAEFFDDHVSEAEATAMRSCLLRIIEASRA